jgi:glycosyltransferase involved in cell wall biosynthesis
MATAELKRPTEAAAPDLAQYRVAVDASELPALQRVRLWLGLAWLRVKEWATSDSRLCRAAVGLAGLVATGLLKLVGRAPAAFRLLFRLHRGNLSAAACRAAERALAEAGPGRDSKINAFLAYHVASIRPSPGTLRLFEDPCRALGTAIFVTKSPKGDEKGLICVHYNHILPFFAKFFDVPRLAQRYHIVIEPSWSGFCDGDILCYTQFPFPIFVEAYEPRDAALIRSLGANLIPVGTSTNWWVDHRKFHPLPHVKKEFDLVMVAGWGVYKRHYRFFEALSRLRRQGRRPRVLLVGYNVGWKKETVLDHARYFGIADQLEVLERVPYDRMNDAVNRAKVHLLWSRKEGVNRAIIECMFAGLPTIVREGFNYGYRYPYINEETGCFATEESLPRAIEELVSRADQMRPREWVMANMSCQRGAEILSQAVGQLARSHGEPWTEMPVLKTTELDRMTYWDSEDVEKFRDDYEFLKACRRNG